MSEKIALLSENSKERILKFLDIKIRKKIVLSDEEARIAAEIIIKRLMNPTFIPEGLIG